MFYIAIIASPQPQLWNVWNPQVLRTNCQCYTICLLRWGIKKV